MKITCDNCGAKYSIADEKVQGKVFKIRCKKCSNIIVVRGTNDEHDLAPADAGGGAADADDGWHVVIGREQTGPMGAAEIRERFAAGEINADSYVWREGFADWQRLAAVPAFSDLGAAAPPVAESAPAAAAAGHADAGGLDLFAGADAGGEETNRTDAGSLFGTDAAPSGGQDLFAGQGGEPAPEADAGAGGGLFSSTPDEAAGGGGDLFGGVDIPSDPAVPVSDDAHMTGQRGENSVLFSLANLQALAMGGKSPVADAAPSLSAAPAAGMASGGGSGLIDIRAMAASTGASTASSHRDELPALGGFASPIAAAPVLLPSASDERPKWVLPAVIGMGSLLVVTMVVLLVVLVGGGKDKEPTKLAANTTTPKAGGAGEEPATKDKPAPGATDTKKTDETKPATKGEEPKGTVAETKAGGTGTAKGRRSTKRRRSGKRGKRPAQAGSPTPKRAAGTSPKRAPRKPSGKRDELDDLIDNATGKGSSKKKRSAAARRPASGGGSDSNLPERLERSQIQSGMSKIKGRVKGCYDRFKVPGLAMVRVTIAGSGKVSSARVSGLFAGTPTGSCVASAVKSARFKRCKKPTTITYPFSLR